MLRFYVWFFVLIFFSISCKKNSETEDKIKSVSHEKFTEIINSSAGVTVTVKMEGNVKRFLLNNTNDFAVRIKCVHYFVNSGERTRWIKTIMPGGKIKISSFDGTVDRSAYSYYVLNLDGVEIGFVKTD